MTLVDHHCHLDFPDFADELDGVIARAKTAGVGLMVTISTRIRRFDRLLQIADAHANVFCSVGTHPHYAHEELDVPVDEIVRLSRHPKVVAIGEAGLDYFYDKSPRAAQEQGFRNHIAAARETQLPLVIHARDADDDMASILEEEMAQRRVSGGAALLHRWRRSGAARAGPWPLCVLLGDTDVQEIRCVARGGQGRYRSTGCWWRPTRPTWRPANTAAKRNEPAYVVETAAELARVKGVTLDELAQATTENFFRLYNKTPRAAIAT